MTAPGDQLPSGQAPASPLPDAAGGGVPTGTPAPSTPDVTPKSQEKMIPAKDLDRLRSTYDQKLAQSQQAMQALQQQLQQLQQTQRTAELASLPEDERLAREIAQHEEEIEQERQQMRQQAQAMAEQQYLYELRNYYLGKGAPLDILQTNDASEMQDNVLQWALTRQIQSANASASTSSAPTPPPVTTSKPAAVGKISWSLLKPGSPEEAEVFKKLENRQITEADLIP